MIPVDAATAAALFSVDPVGVGGVVLRARHGPLRDAWVTLLLSLLPAGQAPLRLPLSIDDAALLGGLDLAATLHAGRPVARTGLLARADGGVLWVGMAERTAPGLAARLALAMDTQAVAVERDGVAQRRHARFGLVALDEGAEPDERVPSALADRMGLWLQLEGEADGEPPVAWQRAEVEAAQALLPHVTCPDEVLEALCAAALALGVQSFRAPLLAVRVARAAAALAGVTEVGPGQAALAARLVLAPRATRLPASADTAPAQEEPPPDEAPPDAAPQDPADAPAPREAAPETESRGPDPSQDEQDQPLQESVLEAATAAVPAGLLTALALGGIAMPRGNAGRSGASVQGGARGRPIGARRGAPRQGERLHLLETLRAAAPWQNLRAREAGAPAHGGAKPRVHVRTDDFRVTRYRQRSQTTTVFVVDASGSAALHRLAEAKGAVELLLADCYVRRDRVALLSFRGRVSELLLPPTRSLVRAKRGLAALPGGGGTPLAAGLDAAGALADGIRRRGETPIVVLLTDGRANIARDGTPGRDRAVPEALAAARSLRLAGLTCLLLDTGPRPQPAAQALAQAMGARYLPLPHAGAQAMSQAVRAAVAAPR